MVFRLAEEGGSVCPPPPTRRVPPGQLAVTLSMVAAAVGPLTVTVTTWVWLGLPREPVAKALTSSPASACPANPPKAVQLAGSAIGTLVPEASVGRLPLTTRPLVGS